MNLFQYICKTVLKLNAEGVYGMNQLITQRQYERGEHIKTELLVWT